MSRPMDQYAVIGNPVEHSRSPFIHGQFGQATGHALRYARVLSPKDGFEQVVRRFAESAGARGCNVTVPFKFEALSLAPRCSARAALAGAANTLRFDTEGWLADNTDGVGLVRDIERNAEVPLAGRRVLLVGAGGAAAGALGPLLEARPAALTVTNRTRSRADELVQRHTALAATCGVALAAAALENCGQAFDIVVNATASSLGQADVPVAAQVLGPGALALDMMYGPAAQPFMRWAEAHGAQARDGLGMLVEQAAQAFLLWRGVLPETGPVLAALRQRWDTTA